MLGFQHATTLCFPYSWAVQGVGADAPDSLCTCWVGLSNGMALPALLGLSFLGMTPVLVTYIESPFTFIDVKLLPSKAQASAFILKLRFPFFPVYLFQLLTR